MSTIFGGIESRDVRDIVTMLAESTGALCNEAAYPTTMDDMEVSTMAESIQSLAYAHYAEHVNDAFNDLISEDAQGMAQNFKNNIAEMHRLGILSENAAPDIRTLTASIATTMRVPYEACYHRLFNTRTVDNWVVEMQDVEPTIAAPGYEEESLIDALSPFAKDKFIHKTEQQIEVLTNGVVPGASSRNLPLTPGMDPLFHVDQDARVVGIDATYADGTPVPAKNVVARRGSSPYFDVKERRLSMEYDIKLQDGVTFETIRLDGRIDFKKNILLHLDASDSDLVTIDKVYFYACASHEEHLRPITTGARNSFRQFVIPTRPHIEVSMPEETRTDIKNGIHYFANTDIITYMTENIALISSRMEDERLADSLESAHMYEAHFSFEAPSNFAYGNLEWFKREFIPFLDQVALAMKNDYNITDCHFRCAVSPYILRILDTDYSLDKSANEESKGSGPINYSIGVKTSTSTFYLISSQRQKDDELTVLLQPNQYKTAQVRSYDYYRYSSFLTDKIRRSDNTRFEAIVYSERNLPVVFNPLQTKLTVDDMYITNKTGKRSFVKL